MQDSPEQASIPQPAPAIVIYRNRTQVIISTIVFLVAVVVYAIKLVALMSMLSSTFQMNTIVTRIVYVAFLLPCLVFGIWVIGNMIQLLCKPGPLLIIDHQGIFIGKDFMSHSFLIPWHEIDEICRDTGISNYLGIRPKDSRQFLRRFSVLMRFAMRSNTFVGFSPVGIPQYVLERPVQEILQQITIFYAHELNMYNIQISS